MPTPDRSLLRALPKVDALLSHPALAAFPAAPLTEAVRLTLDKLRADVLSGAAHAIPGEEELVARVKDELHRRMAPSLRPVLNGTGVVLHTNLGRARLAPEAAKAAGEAAEGYSTLEFDLSSGERGSRYAHVEDLLCELTGAESALVVNNNASSVLLMLSALAAGKEVVVSRGELVEIGGSFRVPEVMEQGGAYLKEVGTTNKTHLSDYERATGDDTAAFLKVHTSNFQIIGFTEGIPLPSLCALAHEKGVWALEDLGSGLLRPVPCPALSEEPTVLSSVAAGVDITCFSGDKLLGGPQAGVLVGKKTLIDKLKKHPLNRALRIDKMTLAALEATLRIYRDYPLDFYRRIPVLAMLTTPDEELRDRADRLAVLLNEAGGRAETTASVSPVGGGSAPGKVLSSFAVCLELEGFSAAKLEQALRGVRGTPVVGRVARDRLMLDVRTLTQDELPLVAAAVREIRSL